MTDQTLPEPPEPPKVSLYEVLTEAQRDAEWRQARDEQRAVLAEQHVAHEEWRKAVAWQSDLFLLIAECLVALAPINAGYYRGRLDALRKTKP